MLRLITTNDGGSSESVTDVIAGRDYAAGEPICHFEGDVLSPKDAATAKDAASFLFGRDGYYGATLLTMKDGTTICGYNMPRSKEGVAQLVPDAAEWRLDDSLACPIDSMFHCNSPSIIDSIASYTEASTRGSNVAFDHEKGDRILYATRPIRRDEPLRRHHGIEHWIWRQLRETNEPMVRLACYHLLCPDGLVVDREAEVVTVGKYKLTPADFLVAFRVLSDGPLMAHLGLLESTPLEQVATLVDVVKSNGVWGQCLKPGQAVVTHRPRSKRWLCLSDNVCS